MKTAGKPQGSWLRPGVDLLELLDSPESAPSDFLTIGSGLDDQTRDNTLGITAKFQPIIRFGGYLQAFSPASSRIGFASTRNRLLSAMRLRPPAIRSAPEKGCKTVLKHA
jgi:hypothetical protein